MMKKGGRGVPDEPSLDESQLLLFMLLIVVLVICGGIVAGKLKDNEDQGNVDFGGERGEPRVD